MNCGFSNLTRLKVHLMPGTMQSDQRFDQVIQDIGLGVAGLMEQFCNRRFGRMVSDQVTYQADRASFVLPRFPLESISAVELKYRDDSGWEEQDISFIQSTSAASGVVYLPDQSDVAKYWGQIRFTYTGGYWFEELEPDDDGYPSVMPAGATALPQDLLAAWQLQCRAMWQSVDKLGSSLLTQGTTGQFVTGSLPELDFPPMVKRMLASYVIMQPI